MTTGITERGLERQICTALTGSSCDPVRVVPVDEDALPSAMAKVS